MSRINFSLLIILSIALISCNQSKTKEVYEQIIEIADSLNSDSANAEIISVDSLYNNPDNDEIFYEEYVIDSAAVGINFKTKGSYAKLKITIIAKQMTKLRYNKNKYLNWLKSTAEFQKGFV